MTPEESAKEAIRYLSLTAQILVDPTTQDAFAKRCQDSLPLRFAINGLLVVLVNLVGE